MSVQLWSDPYLRQSGRTSRLLRAATISVVFQRIAVIVGADKHHVVDLRRQYHETVRHFAWNVLGPTGRVSWSTVAQMSAGLFSEPLALVNGEHSFQDQEHLQTHIITSTSFVFVGEPTAYGKWPKQPLVFVDDFAQTVMVDQMLTAMGFR